MMVITHAAIAAASTILLLGTSDLTYLALAVLDSQLPDFDSTESVLGQSYGGPGPGEHCCGLFARSGLWVFMPCRMAGAGGVTGQVS